MKHIRVIIHACPEEALRGEVVAFLKGINKYVYERVDHEDTEKEYGRQQIEPAFKRILFNHGKYLKNPVVRRFRRQK